MLSVTVVESKHEQDDHDNMMIKSITPFVVNLSPRSNWFFIRAESDDGTRGYGEATLYGWEKLQLAYLEQLL